MKKCKYFIAISIILLLILSGCSSREYTDKFIEFVKNDTSISKNEDGVIELPSGHQIEAGVFYATLVKENNTYNPKVVSTIFSSMGYKWYCDLDAIEKDMKYLGELVIKYAEKKGWENNYHLYITVNLSYVFSEIVYDYETDTMYVPNRYEDYVTLYDKFQTFDISSISKTDSGVEYLLDRRIGRMVHNKFEYDTSWMKSYHVFISDGDFNTYGYEDSYIY